MPAYQDRIGAIAILLTAISWPGATRVDAETPEAASAGTPRTVVARWLELHRTGKRDEASALTTGGQFHRARYLLPSQRDTGVRVLRALGNQRATAVITSSLVDGREGERLLLFWLVRRDGVWLINKSDVNEKRVVEERLRGFWEAGDVRWHVRRDELLGDWEAGPCTPPGVDGIACGSHLRLSDDSYRLVVWGPAGPDPASDDVIEGAWRLEDGRILLSHEEQNRECRVAWMTERRLVVESLDGEGRAEYERMDTARVQDESR